MATNIVDYSFKDIANVANPNGSYKAIVRGCSVVSGPGLTSMGNYPNAFQFSNGAVYCNVDDSKIDSTKFTVRLLMRVKTKVTSRQNLAESMHLPFSIYLDKDPEGGDFIVQGSVGTKVHNWSGVSTRFRKQMLKNRWYEICLAYDTNTVGLFIDGSLKGIWAFPDGTIEKKSSKRLVIGAWVDTRRNPFKGEIAGLQWMADIPAEYEQKIDDARDDAAWHISYKYNSVKSSHYLGLENKAQRYDSKSKCFVQEYTNGWIMHNDAVGAFEIHGAILNKYKVMPATRRTLLGWLVSDELEGKVTHSRKSLFKGGAIYWSPWTWARPVYGQMYLDYETLGEGSSAIGLPTHNPVYVSGGMYQKFQNGQMYCKNGAPKAFEVHGAILSRYNSLGHKGSVLRWPISNESDVKKNGVTVGKFSEFEGGIIYWKSGVGAFEVHGTIGEKYQEYSGPTGPLGFPKSNENDIPNHSGAGKYNVFQGGIIVWYGSMKQTYICPPFKIRFQRIETSDQDPWPKGENDIFMHLYVYRNGAEIFHVRKPNSGDYGNHNTKNINYTIPRTFHPDNFNTEYKFRCRAKDADDVDSDDLLGDITTKLNIHNAWGQRDNNGIYNRQAIKHMKITWSVLPQFDSSQFSERAWNFWGQKNRKTSKLTWAQYAAAFSDVTGDPDTLDHILSPLDYAFFKLVVEGIADGGNCFGMSLEAINAQKKSSVFNGPLNRYSWNQIKNEINIKHAYQVGANAIWWFVGQFLTGNTHDPKDVFTAGRSNAASGNRPIYCITQNYAFTGKPHAILPWKWDKPNPWKVEIFDPNNATGTETLTVNSSSNTFHYNNGNSYNGGAWNGGRFHYMPWSILNSRQRTPIWDAILLLLSGTIIILADSTETTSLTNISGSNLDGSKMKSSDSPRSKFFVPFHAFNGSVGGEFYLRKNRGVGNSFIHKIKGKKTGKLEYAVKNLSTGIKVEGPIRANERCDIDVRRLGLSKSLFNVKSSVEKTLKIQFENSLGNTNDKLTVVMENVRALANKNIKLIPKPGLAGVELEGMKSTFKPRVTIEMRKDGKIFKRQYQINPGTAFRLDFSKIPFNNELRVTNLKTLGGTVTAFNKFRPL